MKARRSTLLASSLLASTACTDNLPHDGQIVLHVTTDAPLPTREGFGLSDPIPLFDTIRFDLFLPDGSAPCSECTRSFGVDSESFRDGSVSIGVVPAKSGVASLARVRLFEAEVELEDEPSVSGSIDAWVRLPPVDREGLRRVHVVLPVAAAGDTLGSADAPIVPAEGRPDPAIVGSFAGATRWGCADEPPDGQACVPGGAFWMGHPKFRVAPDSAWEAGQRRIVVLSPFYLDAREVTVEQFRQFWQEHPDPDDPLPWSEYVPQSAYDDTPGCFPENHGEEACFCTFTPNPGPRDDLPVTCVSRALAAAYCEARGATLPTEAQLEYVMGGAAQSDFVWGQDPPACGEASYGLAFLGQSKGDGSCRLPISGDFPPAPLPPGSGTRDRIVFGGIEVLDLSGNVSEWAADQWNREDEACWEGGLLEDPRCEGTGEDGEIAPAKGGNWSESPELMHPAKRWGLAPLRVWDESVLGPTTGFELSQIGFRCARPAQRAESTSSE